MTSEATRSQAIGRTVRLVADLVRGRAHTRGTAARFLGIGEAAAARQLEAIKANLPGIEVRGTRRGRAYSFSRAPGDNTVLSAGTAIAACFGASLAPLFEETSYGPAMRAATRRIVEKARRARDFEHIDRKFIFHARGGEIALPDSGAHLDEIIEAILSCAWVRLSYSHFASPPTTVDIKPLSIVVYEHQLYVIGCDADGKHHPYRFSRIRSVDRSSNTFAYPERSAYDPKRLLRDSLGIFMDRDLPVIDVKVKLAPRWTGYVKTHHWHPTQDHREVEDGVLVFLRVRHCPELERWVLGFGEDAVVLGPDSLRVKIAERLEGASRKYTLEATSASGDPTPA